MSWITVDNDTSWQDLATAQQIATALNQRLLVASLGSVSSPTNATKVFDFIYECQDAAEELWSHYAPNVIAAGGYANQEDLPDLAYASQAAMFAAAGLGGWRRYPEAGGSTTGKIQDKDMAGPWLFQDLQAVLDVCTRRIVYGDWFTYGGYYDTAAAYYPDGMPSISYETGAENPNLRISRYLDSDFNPYVTCGTATYWKIALPSWLVTGPGFAATAIGLMDGVDADLFDDFGTGVPNGGTFVLGYSSPVDAFQALSSWQSLTNALPWGNIPSGGKTLMTGYMDSMVWILDYSFSP